MEIRPTLSSEARVTAEDDAALARLEDVSARHLARFAFRDPPDICWVRAS